MLYKEEIKNLSTVQDDYVLAHCISADFEICKGIVIGMSQIEISI